MRKLFILFYSVCVLLIGAFAVAPLLFQFADALPCYLLAFLFSAAAFFVALRFDAEVVNPDVRL